MPKVRRVEGIVCWTRGMLVMNKLTARTLLSLIEPLYDDIMGEIYIDMEPEEGPPPEAYTIKINAKHVANLRRAVQILEIGRK
jgi:hypothetical protein